MTLQPQDKHLPSRAKTDETFESAADLFRVMSAPEPLAFPAHAEFAARYFTMR